MQDEPRWAKHITSWKILISAIKKKDLPPAECESVLVRFAPKDETSEFVEAIRSRLGERFVEFLKHQVASRCYHRREVDGEIVPRSEELGQGLSHLRQF